MSSATVSINVILKVTQYLGVCDDGCLFPTLSLQVRLITMAQQDNRSSSTSGSSVCKVSVKVMSVAIRGPVVSMTTAASGRERTISAISILLSSAISAVFLCQLPALRDNRTTATANQPIVLH